MVRYCRTCRRRSKRTVPGMGVRTAGSFGGRYFKDGTSTRLAKGSPLRISGGTPVPWPMGCRGGVPPVTAQAIAQTAVVALNLLSLRLGRRAYHCVQTRPAETTCGMTMPDCHRVLIYLKTVVPNIRLCRLGWVLCHLAARYLPLPPPQKTHQRPSLAECGPMSCAPSPP